MLFFDALLYFCTWGEGPSSFTLVPALLVFWLPEHHCPSCLGVYETNMTGCWTPQDPTLIQSFWQYFHKTLLSYVAGIPYASLSSSCSATRLTHLGATRSCPRRQAWPQCPLSVTTLPFAPVARLPAPVAAHTGSLPALTVVEAAPWLCSGSKF